MNDISPEILESYLYWYKGKVQKITDGDTIVVHFDFGRRHYLDKDVLRLLVINAPEITGAPMEEKLRGLAAKDALACFVTGLPLDKSAEAYSLIDSGNCFVYINTKLDKKDTLSRLLANIYNFKGENVNQKMLDNGFAVVSKWN